MLYAFCASEGRLALCDEGAAALPATQGIVWVDLAEPTEEELDAVRKRFGVEFSKHEAGQNIESSARFFQHESGALHLKADFLGDSSDGPENASVQFVI